MFQYSLSCICCRKIAFAVPKTHSLPLAVNGKDFLLNFVHCLDKIKFQFGQESEGFFPFEMKMKYALANHNTFLGNCPPTPPLSQH